MLRIYLSGRMCIEGNGVLLEPGEFPGRQGRALFAYLVMNRRGPISRSALADALWAGAPPSSWDAALSAVVSKLRFMLTRVGVEGSEALTGLRGTYELRLPTGSWVDQEAAQDAIHEAEALIAAGHVKAAYGPSAVARLIARRPFLPGHEATWVEARRDHLAGILARALECRARVYLWNGEYPLAVESARELLELRPFRESAYRLLMKAHAAAGNTAEALRVYDECRRVIADELGVGPSPETRAVHEEVLRGV
jgi:SARP family transcriptional regulator, regulator of embCAB operon